MSNKFLLTIIIFLTLTVHGQADKTWSLGAGAGMTTYYGDLSARFMNVKSARPGYHFFVDRAVTSGIGLRLEYQGGSVKGNDRAPYLIFDNSSSNNPDFARSLNFKTDYHHVNLSLRFSLDNDKIISSDALVAPYFLLGVGIGKFKVYGDLTYDGGNRYYYWSDQTIRDLAEDDPQAGTANVIEQDGKFETNLSALDTERDYSQRAVHFPFGVGLKFKFSERFYFSVESRFVYHLTDYLDDVGGNAVNSALTDDFSLYAADPAGVITGDRGNTRNGLKDILVYQNASLVYTIKRRKSNFKGMEIKPVDVAVHAIQLPKTREATGEPQDSTGADSLETLPAGGLVEEEGPAVLPKEELSRMVDSLVRARMAERETEKNTATGSKYVVYAETAIFEPVYNYPVPVPAGETGTEVSPGEAAEDSVDRLVPVDSTLLPTDTILPVDTMALDTSGIPVAAAEVPSVVAALPGTDVVATDTIDITDTTAAADLDTDSVIIEIEAFPADSIVTLPVDTAAPEIPDSSANAPADTVAVGGPIVLPAIPPANPEVIVPVEPLPQDSISALEELGDTDVDSVFTNVDSTVTDTAATSSAEMEIQQLRSSLAEVQSEWAAFSEKQQAERTRDSLEIASVKAMLNELSADSTVVIANRGVNTVDTTLRWEMTASLASLEARMEALEAAKAPELETIDTTFKDTLFSVSAANDSSFRAETKVAIERLEARLNALLQDTVEVKDAERSKAIEGEDEIQSRISILESRIATLDSMIYSMQMESEYDEGEIEADEAARVETIQYDPTAEIIQENLNAMLDSVRRQNDRNYYRIKTVVDSLSVKESPGTDQYVLELMEGLREELNLLRVQNDPYNRKLDSLKQVMENTTLKTENVRLDKQDSMITAMRIEMDQLKMLLDTKAVDTTRIDRGLVSDTLTADSTSKANLVDEVVKRLRQDLIAEREQADSVAAAARRTELSELESRIAEVTAKFEAMALQLEALETEEEVSPEPVVVEEPKAEVPSPFKIYFKSGQMTVQPVYFDRLSSIAAYLSAHDGAKVELKGFADTVGNADFNLKLSGQRAESVRKALIMQYGVDADRILVIAMGEEAGVDPSLAEFSRRVDVRILP